MDAPSLELVARVTRIFGHEPTAWRRMRNGYTPAERWVVVLDDRASAFLKVGVDEMTDDWLRREHAIYSRLEAPFLPRLLAWDDDGARPLLALEDLSAAHWPPPWANGNVEAVLHALARVRATRFDALPSIRRFASGSRLLQGWMNVRNDPAPFLSLGLCSAQWLDQAALKLDALTRNVRLGGDDLIHLDVRSDNICFDADRTLLIDWNSACRGNGEVDVAFWLPSLHAEGGPLPEEVMPDEPGWAALVSGFFAARAGLPTIPTAPRVREVQLQQLRSALPWAQRALNLPALDGPNAS